MSVFKRDGSPYYSYQFMVDGEKYGPKSTKKTIKSEALMIEAKVRKEVEAGAYQGRKKQITLEDSLNQYKEASKGTSSYNNIKVQSKFIGQHLNLKSKIHTLKTKDVEKLKQIRVKNEHKAGTVNLMFTVLRQTIKFSRDLGYQIPTNIKYNWMKTKKGKLRWLSLEEEKLLLDNLDPNHQAGFSLMPPHVKTGMQDNYDYAIMLLDLGARGNEVCEIEWKDVNFKNNTVYFYRPKVDNEAYITMTDRLRQVLTRRFANRNNDAYVLMNKARTDHRSVKSYTGIARRIKMCGLKDVSIHTLRHTAASRWLQHGLRIEEVKEMLGHNDIDTTMIYSHLDFDKVTTKAANILNNIHKQDENVEPLHKFNITG